MTVVVPAYQAAHLLALSVPAVLALRGVEAWIWVDDGSTDGTSARLRALTRHEPRARVLTRPENEGRGAARNAGLREVTSQTVLFLDADVSPPPDLAEAMGVALRTGPAVAAVATLRPLPGDASDPYAAYLRYFPRGIADAAAGDRLAWRHFLTTAVGVRTSVLRDVGGFDATVAYGEDVELASRLAERHPEGLVACGRTVDLRGVDTLDGVLRRMRDFGRALAQMPDRVLRTAELEVLTAPSWRRRLAASRRGAAVVRRSLRVLPAAGVALGVRYLLAHALVRAFDASDRPS